MQNLRDIQWEGTTPQLNEDPTGVIQPDKTLTSSLDLICFIADKNINFIIFFILLTCCCIFMTKNNSTV